MEHFEQRWFKLGDGMSFSIKPVWVEVTGKSWLKKSHKLLIRSGRYIANVCTGFDGDEDGALTAQRICDYHNLVVPALRAVARDLKEHGYVTEHMGDGETVKMVELAIGTIGEGKRKKEDDDGTERCT